MAVNKKNIKKILSIILCILFLPSGFIYFYMSVARTPFVYDSTFKFSIAAMFFGFVFLYDAIKK